MTTAGGLDLEVRRLATRLSGDARRTITRFFWTGEDRARKIMARVRALGDVEVEQLKQRVGGFRTIHPDLDEILSEHYQRAMKQVGLPADDDPPRQLLIGSYFTMEYAYESAALFNPSMVPERDQSQVPEGSTRFLMSLRAVGEGHVSSIVFRRGVIDKNGEISISPMGQSLHRLRRGEERAFEKSALGENLKEAGFYNQWVERILARLGERIMASDVLAAADAEGRESPDPAAFRETADRLVWLANSNYEIEVPRQYDISQLVLFPISDLESQGMEDMRLVHFIDADGAHCYYGTYTAYDGSRILPQLLVAKGAGKAEVHSLHGSFARNKGLALFPRQVDGQYMMLGRCDAENLYLLRSKSIRTWNEGQVLQGPQRPWEFVQIGNCGSPIETEAGWLVLTHGVGPMRRYCMGAMLLDLKDPAKIIGQLAEPLLAPVQDERIGYVPNVVYSCGGMVHGDLLVIPYGISDAATGFATVSLKKLLAALTR